jgi:hypothetical protein
LKKPSDTSLIFWANGCLQTTLIRPMNIEIFVESMKLLRGAASMVEG